MSQSSFVGERRTLANTCVLVMEIGFLHLSSAIGVGS